MGWLLGRHIVYIITAILKAVYDSFSNNAVILASLTVCVPPTPTVAPFRTCENNQKNHSINMSK